MIGNTSKLSIEITVDDKGAVAAIRKVGTASEKAGRKGKDGFKGMGREVDKFSAKTRASTLTIRGLVATATGLVVVREGFRLITNEVKTGFKAVEDYNLSMATMTGFMITNSRKLQQGDLAGAYRDANTYAGKLIPKLEIIAAKTLGTGKDLQAITETMMMHGVVLDINNKKEVEGLKNITNVLKMVTAGQNQDIQMRQEINGLMTGNLRMQDRLPTLLHAIDPALKEHLKLWKQQGSTIEHVGELLTGFDPATQLVEQTWTSIGSTMETINTKVLRGGMQPIFTDLMNKAKEINSLFMDKDGHLTKFSYEIQDNIHDAWDYAKHLGSELKGFAFDPETAKVIKTLGVAAAAWATVSAGRGIAALGGAAIANPEISIPLAGYYAYQNRGVISDSTLSGPGVPGKIPGMEVAQAFDAKIRDVKEELASWQGPWGSFKELGRYKDKQEAIDTLQGQLQGLERILADARAIEKKSLSETYAATGKVLSNEKMIAKETAKTQTNGRPEMVKQIPELTPAHLKQPHLETEAEWQAKANTTAAKHNALLNEGKRLYESTRTPLERYNEAVGNYKDLLAEGAIDQGTYNRAIEAAGDTLDKVAAKTGEDTHKMSVTWKSAYTNMQSFTGGAFYDALSGHYDNIGAAFQDMLTRQVSEYGAAMTQMALMGDPSSGGTGLLGTLATGIASFFTPSSPAYGPETAPPADWHAPMAYPGRAIGGSTAPRGMYEVNEDQPEVVSVGSHNYLMMGSQGGKVRPVSQGAGSGSRPQITVNVLPAPGTQAQVQQSDDGMSLDVIITKVEDGISGNVQKGTGSLAATMEGTYGLNRAAGAY